MLLTPLAQGGMAEIWLARASGPQGFEKLVVIKRMDSALQHEPEYVEMFLTEARLAAQLSHPHVVQIHELGEQAGSLYIVMEYLDGENLAVVRRTGQKYGLPLLDHLAARLISWAADGLHYAHTRVGHDGTPLRIVHRDVSPQNLIATMDGNLKIVDFGIARQLSQHTHSGKLKGKFAYMAPEQARGEPVDPRSDVFSLGIVLFELVTRTRFLPNMDDLAILQTLAGNEPLPRPRDRRPDVPPRLEAVMMKALERKRESRFQSAREFHEALEAWLRETGLPSSSADVADYLRTIFARRIHERRQLIESAMRAELTPGAAQRFDRLARAGGRRLGFTSDEQSRHTIGSQPPKRNLVFLAIAAVLLVGLSVGLTLALRPADTPTLVVKARPAVVVEPAVKPPPPVLVVETVPPGAAILVDGKDAGPSPAQLDDLGVGEHRVEASLSGYQPTGRTVSLAKPGERVVVQLAMLPVTPPGPEPVPVDSGAVAVDPRPVPRATKPKPAQQPTQRGLLTLQTSPWTTVYLGDQKLGDTPLINVSLPAGRQVLRLVNAEKGLESSIEVEIVPNGTTVKKLRL